MDKTVMVRRRATAGGRRITPKVLALFEDMRTARKESRHDDAWEISFAIGREMGWDKPWDYPPVEHPDDDAGSAACERAAERYHLLEEALEAARR